MAQPVDLVFLANAFQQTIEAVEPAGLRLMRVVEVPPYHYGAAFVRPSS